jgi:hypothetical protein
MHKHIVLDYGRASRRKLRAIAISTNSDVHRSIPRSVDLFRLFPVSDVRTRPTCSASEMACAALKKRERERRSAQNFCLHHSRLLSPFMCALPCVPPAAHSCASSTLSKSSASATSSTFFSRPPGLVLFYFDRLTIHEHHLAKNSHIDHSAALVEYAPCIARSLSTSN